MDLREITEQLCEQLFVLEGCIDDDAVLAFLNKHSQKDDPYSSTKGSAETH